MYKLRNKTHNKLHSEFIYIISFALLVEMFGEIEEHIENKRVSNNTEFTNKKKIHVSQGED